MIRYVEDPALDFEVWDAARDAEDEERLHCDQCGRVIDDIYYEVYAGEYLCPDCMDENFRRCI